jgi:hypothetical protein
LVAVNATWGRGHEPRPIFLYPQGYIILAVNFHDRETVYYDRGEHFVYDKGHVNGWYYDESHLAYLRAQQLQEMVGPNATVIVQTR